MLEVAGEGVGIERDIAHSSSLCTSEKNLLNLTIVPKSLIPYYIQLFFTPQFHLQNQERGCSDSYATNKGTAGRTWWRA